MPDAKEDAVYVLGRKLKDEGIYTSYSSDKLVKRILRSSETEGIILRRFLKARRFLVLYAAVVLLPEAGLGLT